ncbi:hypothetical protein FKM82_020689 [Ascaphus truei]
MVVQSPLLLVPPLCEYHIGSSDFTLPIVTIGDTDVMTLIHGDVIRHDVSRIIASTPISFPFILFSCSSLNFGAKFQYYTP